MFRMSIAIALIGKSKLILLDLANNTLDVTSKMKLYEYLVMLRRSKAILIS